MNRNISEITLISGLTSGLKKIVGEDFPGDPVVKNPPAAAGDTGSIPGPGKSHMLRRN